MLVMDALFFKPGILLILQLGIGMHTLLFSGACKHGQCVFNSWVFPSVSFCPDFARSSTSCAAVKSIEPRKEFALIWHANSSR
jgi:hypothetical protein